jgi:hypothetical protein
MWEIGFAAILAWEKGICNRYFLKEPKVRMPKVKASRFLFATAT